MTWMKFASVYPWCRLAEESGARFKDANHLASPCPLPRHAGDRSSLAFTIYNNGQRWKCHSACPPDANGGDIFTFYMAWKGVDFKTAVAELAERAGVMDEPSQSQRLELPPQVERPLPLPVEPAPAWRSRAEQFIVFAEQNLAGESGAGARQYLEQERGLWPETWQAFRLGYNPKNLYDAPERWGMEGKKIWLPRGITIPGLRDGQPWYVKVRRALPGQALGEVHRRNGMSRMAFPKSNSAGHAAAKPCFSGSSILPGCRCCCWLKASGMPCLPGSGARISVM